MYSKKAQMEMIGIALVIVLLIIGMTFFLTRSIAPQEDVHGIYERKQLAQNTLDVMIKSLTQCRNLDFITLFEDCGKNYFTGGSIQCGATGSCGYISSEMDYILNRTLASRQFPYVFVAYRGDNEYDGLVFPAIETGDKVAGIDCTHDRIKNARVEVETPGIQPIPLYPGTLNLKLYICID